MIDDEHLEVFLEHHGVKGMKWGVRKAERGARRTARREGNAKKYTARADKTQAEIDRIKAKPLKSKGAQRRRDSKVRELQKEKARHEEDADRKRHGKLSQNQKKVLIGAGVVAAVIGTKIAYNQIQSGEANRLLMNGRQFVQNGGKKGGWPWKVNADLARKDMDVDELFDKVVRPVNPDYGRYGSKMNCRRCTFAYEMRRRGLDVSATRTKNGRGQDLSGIHNVLNPGEENWAKPGKFGILPRVIREHAQQQKTGQEGGLTKTMARFMEGGGLAETPIDHNDILRSIKKQGLPDGARGELGIQWNGGGGHSMAWEIVKGKVVVFDNQTGDKYLESPGDFVGIPGVAKAAITRLDNVPLNEEFLKRWIKNNA